MARKKRGDEALIRMLTDDARMAAGGTPKARRNHLKPSRTRLHRELVLEAVCHGCGDSAVVSRRQRSGWHGGWVYRKLCARCAGLAPTGMLGHPEPVREETTPRERVRRSGVKVFA